AACRHSRRKGSSGRESNPSRSWHERCSCGTPGESQMNATGTQLSSLKDDSATPQRVVEPVEAPATAMAVAVASLDLPAVELEAPDLETSSVVRLSIKRALDVLVSLTSLVLLAPAMVLIATLIKLGDGGPIFFAQRRVGLRGRTFPML